MTDEERDKTINFILEQQAQLTATVGKLSDTVERTAGSITALLAIAEIQSGEIRELGESLRAVDERQRESEERRREADERLNALINTVERFVSGGGGNPGA